MQVDAETTTEDLFNACSVLFGSGVNISRDFLKYLRASGLKEAYRRRAYETHPDRAAILSESPLCLEERFKEVNLAYEKLSTFIERPRNYPLRDRTFRRTTGADATRKRRRADESHEQRKSGYNFRTGRRHGLNENLWQGRLPGRQLLLGRFLYYNGIITLGILINAIVWQARQRPRVGNIAIDWDWLNENDIHSILARRKPGEKFCECALRCGYIKPYQRNLLLVRQQMLQPRIGSFFVEHNIVTPREMETIIEQLRKHNWKYSRTRA